MAQPSPGLRPFSASPTNRNANINVINTLRCLRQDRRTTAPATLRSSAFGGFSLRVQPLFFRRLGTPHPPRGVHPAPLLPSVFASTPRIRCRYSRRADPFHRFNHQSLPLQRTFTAATAPNLATSLVFLESGKVFHVLFHIHLAISLVFLKSGKVFPAKSLKSFQKPCHIAAILNKWQGRLLLRTLKPCHFAEFLNKWQGRLLLQALKPCHFAVFFNKWQGRLLK